MNAMCGIEPLPACQAGYPGLAHPFPGHRPNGLSPGLVLTARWADAVSTAPVAARRSDHRGEVSRPRRENKIAFIAAQRVRNGPQEPALSGRVPPRRVAGFHPQFSPTFSRTLCNLFLKN